jgi:aspartate beta-hydroxylase
MSTPPTDPRMLALSGAAALRRGDARTARDYYGRIITAGKADASSLIGLARACRGLDDRATALTAVDKALVLEPRNLPALILKADLLAEAGDARAASSFYQFAVKMAPPASEMPVELRDEVARAQAMCARYLGEFEAFLEDRLARRGSLDGRSAARFRQSLDLLLGRKKIYYQQPRIFHFPELPQIQFHDRDAFPWLDAVEAALPDIRAELNEVLQDASSFKPYVQRVPERPRKDLAGLDGNADWSAFYMWKDGDIVPDNAARCPRTMAVMDGVPLTRTKGRSPSVLFSLLRPGAHIPPHTGLVNTRLICHLPLVVPPGCGLRVGNDVRTPEEGKAWVFDDTIEHEAWNRSDRTRVILLFEIWRPELTEEERGLVAAMFEAIDAYSGQPPDWSI